MSLTLCWRCANAVPGNGHGCPWSIQAKPVEGWEAKPTKVGAYCNGNREIHGTDSYDVKKCPMFEQDVEKKELIVRENKNRKFTTVTNLDTGEKIEKQMMIAEYILNKGLASGGKQTIYRKFSKKLRESEDGVFECFGVHWKAEYVRTRKEAEWKRRRIKCVQTGEIYKTVKGASDWLSGVAYKAPRTVLNYMVRKFKESDNGKISLYDYDFEEVNNEN